MLRPQVRRPRVSGLFPAPTRFHSHDRRIPVLADLQAIGQRAVRAASWLRCLPRGQLQRYLLYVLAVLVPLLAWAIRGGGGR